MLEATSGGLVVVCDFLQCEAPGHDSVQLVQITPITMVYGKQITIVTGLIDQLISGGHHIVVVTMVPMQTCSIDVYSIVDLDDLGILKNDLGFCGTPKKKNEELRLEIWIP